MPSFILIHPTVWPQYTSVKTDNGLIAYGETFYKWSPKSCSVKCFGLSPYTAHSRPYSQHYNTREVL